MTSARSSLMSGIAGIATAGIAHSLSDLGSSLLRPLGLRRRHSSWPQNLAYLGTGILVGGVGALLLAPSSGAQTRERIAKKAGDLKDSASKQVHALGEQMHREVDGLRLSGDEASASTSSER